MASNEELDEIFGNFSKEMSYASTLKDYKGLCGHCKEPVIGASAGFKAMGQMFHADHFLCDQCKTSIPSGKPFLIHPPTQKPYHSECYEKKFYEECQACHKNISDAKVLHAKGKDDRELAFHAQCFQCGIVFLTSEKADDVTDQESAPKGCGKAIEDPNTLLQKKYYIQSGHVYCDGCFEEHFIPACAECNRKIIKELAPETNDEDVAQKIRYFSFENKPYCSQCYDAKFIPVCVRCQKKIRKDGLVDGTYLSVGDDKYHAKCFSCFECGKEFEDRKAYVLNDRELYCREHYDTHASSKTGSNKNTLSGNSKSDISAQ